MESEEGRIVAHQKPHFSSLTAERIWLVYITHQAFALSELGEINFIFINYRSLSCMFWILRWWALWKAAYKWNLGAYVSLKTLVGLNRRQIQVLSSFSAPCSVQRHWPAASVIIPGFNLSLYWAIFSLITISANTKSIKGNNSRTFSRLVKMSTRKPQWYKQKLLFKF